MEEEEGERKEGGRRYERNGGEGKGSKETWSWMFRCPFYTVHTCTCI